MIKPNERSPKDPDEFIRAYGADAFRKVLEAALPLSDMLWIKLRLNPDLKTVRPLDTPERRAKFEADVLKVCSEFPHALTRKHYLADYRKRLDKLFGDAPRKSNVISISSGLAENRLTKRQSDNEPGLGPVLRGAHHLMPKIAENAVVIEHPFKK